MTTIGLPVARTVVNVLVTGGRHYTDRDSILVAFRAIETAAGWRWPGPYRFRLVHGACPMRRVNGRNASADMLADRVARQLLWEVVESAPGVAGFPAPWRQYGNAAGGIRNGWMVQRMLELDGERECVAFPDPDSRGTWDCVRRAREADIFTWVAAPGMGIEPDMSE